MKNACVALSLLFVASSGLTAFANDNDDAKLAAYAMYGVSYRQTAPKNVAGFGGEAKWWFNINEDPLIFQGYTNNGQVIGEKLEIKKISDCVYVGVKTIDKPEQPDYPVKVEERYDFSKMSDLSIKPGLGMLTLVGRGSNYICAKDTFSDGHRKDFCYKPMAGEYGVYIGLNGGAEDAEIVQGVRDFFSTVCRMH